MASWAQLHSEANSLLSHVILPLSNPLRNVARLLFNGGLTNLLLVVIFRALAAILLTMSSWQIKEVKGIGDY